MSTTYCPVNIPGPRGLSGADGADGADGTNGYCLLTAGFTMPAHSGSVTVAVDNSDGFTVGEPVFCQNAGTFQITAIPDSTSLTLLNLEDGTGAYDDNVPPGTAIANSSKIVHTGFQGATGLAGSGTAPADATYITQTPDGDLSAEQALSTLASGYAKVTTGTGVITTQAPPIPIADGGTNATTAAGARTSLGLGAMALLGTTAGGDLTGTYPNPTLAAFGPGAATYGSATAIPVIQVDAKGRIQAVTPTTIASGAIRIHINLSGTASYAILATDDCILNQHTGATITLPDPATSNGKLIYIKNEGAVSCSVATFGGEWIEAVPGPRAINNFCAELYISDGSNWWVLAEYAP